VVANGLRDLSQAALRESGDRERMASLEERLQEAIALKEKTRALLDAAESARVAEREEAARQVRT
jgi:hypothetical protein